MNIKERLFCCRLVCSMQQQYILIIIITIGLLMLLSVLFIITHLHILLESSIYNIQSFSTFSS